MYSDILPCFHELNMHKKGFYSIIKRYESSLQQQELQSNVQQTAGFAMQTLWCNVAFRIDFQIN